MNVYVLLRRFEALPGTEPPEATVMGVYTTRRLLRARVRQVIERNDKHPTEIIGTMRWRLGPAEDEGFFGDRAVIMWVEATELHSG